MSNYTTSTAVQTCHRIELTTFQSQVLETVLQAVVYGLSYNNDTDAYGIDLYKLNDDEYQMILSAEAVLAVAQILKKLSSDMEETNVTTE